MVSRRVDLSSFVRSIALFSVLMGFFLPAFVWYDRLGQEVRSSRTSQAADQMAMRFAQLSESKAGLLTLAASTVADEALVRVQGPQNAISQILSEQGFVATLWTSAAGQVTWLGAVPTAVDAGLIAAAFQETQIQTAATSPLMTQLVRWKGLIPAFGLTVPVHGPKGELRGWLGGVLAISSLTGAEDDGTKALYTRIEMHGQGTPVFSDPPLPLPVRGIESHKAIRVFNRNLEVTVIYRSGIGLLKELEQLRGWIVGGVLIACTLLGLFAYKLLASRRWLQIRLEKELVQSVLLNLLVHDIVNPLLIVRLGLERVLRMADGEFKAQLQKVDHAVTQVGDVIARVKDMRAVELGKIRLSPTPVSLNDVIASTLELFEARCREKGLVPDFRPCPGDPQVLVDRVSFQNNVMNNLVSNAVKFSEPGGMITVRADVREKDVLVEVVDHGIGMSEQVRSHLFAEDIMTTKPGTMGEPGTGIGMLQVRAYTRIFGGKVAVESRQKPTDGTTAPHGTRISLTLPLVVVPLG